MKLSVIVPVYNEEKTVGEILQRVLSCGIDCEIIVVDDGSTDGSSGVVKALRNPRIKILRRDKNEGKASAVRWGIKRVSGSHILIQDADLEYDPSDYHKLLKSLQEAGGEIVYGSRFPQGKRNMFTTQKIANKFLTALTNVLYGSSLEDMETCYKLIPVNLMRSLDLKEEKFGIEAEITAKLLKMGCKIKNVPVSYRGRSYSRGKKIKFTDALAAAGILFKYRFFK